jgi:hypothetical protein
MEKYIFRQCTLTKLDKLFGLRQVFASATLDQWLQSEIPLSDYEAKTLHELRSLLVLNAPGWNEQELALHFIGPLLSLVHFTEPYRFNLFAERQISAVIPTSADEIELSGAPAGIIATGFREPEIPMFAFTEYKRQLDPEGDPAGQTLAAMLVGQRLNPNPIPLYGCYVIGRDWFFMVLEQNHYVISHGHNALQPPELEDILRIFKNLKRIILDLTAE